MVEEVPRVDRRSEAPAEDAAGPHLLDGPSVGQEDVQGRCELVRDQELSRGEKQSQGRHRRLNLDEAKGGDILFISVSQMAPQREG